MKEFHIQHLKISCSDVMYAVREGLVSRRGGYVSRLCCSGRTFGRAGLLFGQMGARQVN